ncbi:natural resistance-associated macrophage protein 1 [Actinidia rufa]|uniref:Natural resistance-associated macrophage protein 1 n=1 Tax=Actinidia rufa TaxID=165716 RepID=A0A7J0FDB2_9ERIC|nr:natural resistance-associated macrophage protein 1 [Actinidia rufa]
MVRNLWRGEEKSSRQKSNGGLETVGENVLGKSSSTTYAIPLLASGQSSTITGTYAGQYIMQGFLDLKIRKWMRNLMTRSIAITPSLIVSIIGGSSVTGRLILIALIIVVSWILGLEIIGINIYYLSTGFIGWMIHNSLPKVATVSIAIIVFPLMAVYIIPVIYLIFRKDTVVTFSEPTKHFPEAQTRMETGHTRSEEGFELGRAPYREDLAEVLLPQ